MTRLNLILFVALMMTALGVVTAQHKSRKLYFELQQQHDAAKQYEIEWGQLQLEQSTWAMHSRIESIATKHMNMEVPDPKRIQVVTVVHADKTKFPAEPGKVPAE
ncbi:Cell division protein FtsL [Methylophilaceae bacterium]|nr:Cell division protein FtsL [Methylophilaceae bacterium]